MNEICICAAWKTVEGPIIRGHRHAYCLIAIRDVIGLTPLREPDAQGFITSTGRFVDRREGAQLQKASRAWSARTGLHFDGDVLFSEDLY